MITPPLNLYCSAVSLSAHARNRCRQRGTSVRMLTTVYDWADLEVPVGGGFTALSISAQTATEMRAEGCPIELLERARRRALVQRGGNVITVVAGRERRGRHYRHRMWRRPSSRSSR